MMPDSPAGHRCPVLVEDPDLDAGPRAGPTLPGRARHSSGEIRVAPPSLAPYSSWISASGKASIILNLTGTGHGAAACTIREKLETSKAARSSSGISRIRMKWAGTMNERVPRRWLTSSRNDRASNCSVITVAAPMYSEQSAHPRCDAW